jgi:hypothetical protein
MELPIPKIVKKIWDAWNLRSCILLSLSLQAILVLFSFLRKRTRSKLVIGFIWFAYLLADWIAPVAIGLISKSNCGPKGNEELMAVCKRNEELMAVCKRNVELMPSCKRNEELMGFCKGNEELMAFWASFLLLHLGGPDTITSFALEDNEFWLRHFMGLILQVLVTAYIFYQSIPKNKLCVPTVMVFFVGTVKYVERTRALYLASLNKFGGSVLPPPNAGPDYQKVTKIYSSMRSESSDPVSRQVDVMPNPEVGNTPDDSERTLGDMQLLQEAYRLFEKFKGLIVGLLLSSKERDMSRDFFLTITPNEAFRLIECELSFMYEVLHTKVVVIRCKIGYFLRFICFTAILVALGFFSHENQHEFHNVHKFDIILTYILLGGALVVEVISILMLILSDWTLIALKNSWSKRIVPIILKRRKWSGSISQYDMISYCLNDPPAWVYQLADYVVVVREILDKMKILRFSHSEKVRDDLKSFIFDQLRWKSLTANNLRAGMDASSKRGEWALLQTSSYDELKWSIEDYQYAESLLIWHIATELCYEKEKGSSDSDRKKCKLLSDYMFYLLVMKPIMMAPVLGNWLIVFQDTCAEAKRFFHGQDIRTISNKVEACGKILEVDTKYRPVTVKGSISKSVFFDGCILAQKLSDLKIDKWKLMSRVWVELMSYAAINCRPNVHAQQPSRGGELLTFIWLLMNHLGLGTQFYQQERQAVAKLVLLK